MHEHWQNRFDFYLAEGFHPAEAHALATADVFAE